MAVVGHVHVMGVNTRSLRLRHRRPRSLRRKSTKRMTSYIHHVQRYSTIMSSIFTHTYFHSHTYYTLLQTVFNYCDHYVAQ